MNKIEYNISKRSLSRAIKWLGVSFFTLYAPFFVSCSEWNDHTREMDWNKLTKHYGNN